MTFSERLEALIEENKTTQKAIAEYAGVRYASISDWKKGGSFPRADIAIKIAQALNTTVEELIEGEAGAEYVRGVVRNDPAAIQVPDRILPIVECLLVLEEKELRGIQANVEELAADKKGLGSEATEVVG